MCIASRSNLNLQSDHLSHICCILCEFGRIWYDTGQIMVIYHLIRSIVTTAMGQNVLTATGEAQLQV